MEKHRTKIVRKTFIKDDISDMVWEYLRHHLRSTIPQEDHNFRPWEYGVVIGNFKVFNLVGTGTSATVWRLKTPNRRNDASGLVVKAIAEQSKNVFLNFQAINNQIEVMKALSSFRLMQPNIIKFARSLPL